MPTSAPSTPSPTTKFFAVLGAIGLVCGFIWYMYRRRQRRAAGRVDDQKWQATFDGAKVALRNAFAESPFYGLWLEAALLRCGCYDFFFKKAEADDEPTNVRKKVFGIANYAAMALSVKYICRRLKAMCCALIVAQCSTRSWQDTATFLPTPVVGQCGFLQVLQGGIIWSPGLRAWATAMHIGRDDAVDRLRLHQAPQHVHVLFVRERYRSRIPARVEWWCSAQFHFVLHPARRRSHPRVLLLLHAHVAKRILF